MMKKKENGGANVNNIAIKYQKPETKKITTTDIKNIPSRGLNNQSNVTQTLNKNISMNGTPLEKSSNISKTSNLIDPLFIFSLLNNLVKGY